MTKAEAIKLAIAALEWQTTEIYEGEEYDDPYVQKFVAMHDEAIEEIRKCLL